MAGTVKMGKPPAEAKAVAAKLSPRDKKTMGSIVGLADGVVVAAEKRRDPHVDIPSRTLSNVHYSPRKKIIEMGNATNRRQLFDLAQAKAYMQTMLVASGTKKLLTQGKTTSLRGLFGKLGVTDAEGRVTCPILAGGPVRATDLVHGRMAAACGAFSKETAT